MPGGALYKFIHQVHEMQQNLPIYKTELQGTLKDWILDAIGTEDPVIAQEIRLQCPREEVKPIINYLAEHFGTASQVETLAIALHNQITKQANSSHHSQCCSQLHCSNCTSTSMALNQNDGELQHKQVW